MGGRSWCKIAALAVLALFLGAAHGARADAYVPQPLRPPATIHLGLSGVSTEVPLFVALDQGYFAAEGLKVEIYPTSGNSSDILTLLATGRLDFAVVGPNASWFNAVARGVDVKAIAAVSVVEPSDASSELIVRADWVRNGRYKTIADLKGATVAVGGLASTSQWMVLLALRKANLTAADVRFTVLPFPDFLPAISHHAIDAAWAVEPTGTLAADGGFAEPVVRVGQLVPGFPFVMFGNPRTPLDVAGHALVAMLRAERFVYAALREGHGDRQAVYRALAAHTSIKDPAQWAHYHINSADPNGDFDPGIFAPLQDFFIHAGVMKTRVDVDRLVDRRALDYALARLGRVASTRH